MRNWKKSFIIKLVLLSVIFLLPLAALDLFNKFNTKIYRYLLLMIIESVIFLVTIFVLEIRLMEYYSLFKEKLRKITRSFSAENSVEEKFKSLDSMSNFEYFLSEEIDKLGKYFEQNNQKIIELEKENYTKFQVREYQLKSVVKELEKMNDRMKRKESILDSYVEMQEEMMNSVKNYNMFFDEVLFFLEKKLKITDIMVVRYDMQKPIVYTRLSNEKKLSEFELEELKKCSSGLYYKKEINAILGYEVIFILASKRYFHGYIFINGLSSKYLEYPVFMKIVSTVYMGILNMADNIREREESGNQVENLKLRIGKLNMELSKTQEELETQLGEISNMYEEIVTLYEVGKSIVRVIDIKEIETYILDMMTDIIGTESAYLFYFRKDREQAILKNSFFKNGNIDENFLKDMKIFIKNSSLYYDLSNKFQEIVINKIERNDYAKFLSEYLKGNLLNMLVTPIYYGENIIGGIILCNKSGGEFTAGNISLASALTNQLGIAAQNVEFLEKEIQIKKEEEQLKIASQIQSRLFPSEFPFIKNFQMFGVSLPAKSVGGDYYDIVQLNENEAIGIVADVSGKGVPAALLVSMVRTIFRLIINEKPDISPGELLSKMNILLCKEELDGRFVTAFCYKIFSKERKVQFSDAGHGNMMIYKCDTDTVIECKNDSTVLGVMSNENYENNFIEIAKKDILLIYTDGVTEERNGNGDLFGEERLEELLLQEHKYPAEFITRRIYRQVYKFIKGENQADDITILTLKGV